MTGGHAPSTVEGCPLKRERDFVVSSHLRKTLIEAQYCGRMTHPMCLIPRWLESSFTRVSRGLLKDTCGNVLVMAALGMPVLIGMCGLAIEGGNWYQAKRAIQNAADTAAIAAATNGSSSYIAEARAVAAQYGFTHGEDSTTVEVSDTASCPSGGADCYSVTITQAIPLIFAPIVGFEGNTTADGAQAVSVQSMAVAKQGSEPRKYCVMALATSGEAIRSNGGPKADLSGCNIISNADMNCNGHDLKAVNADAVGYVDTCGLSRTPNVEPVPDPYEDLAANIPSTSSCGATPTATNISGSQSWTGTKVFCGDVNLKGNVTLTGASVIIVIKNGSLNLGQYVMKNDAGKRATIIFTGTNAYSHQVTGTKKGALLDIVAPDSGIWKGIAIYYDPYLTSGVDLDYSGNKMDWAITGVVYMPHSEVTFSGAVGKGSAGTSKCMILVVNTLLINGTGAMLSQDCETLGWTMPTGSMPGRVSLVN